MTVISGVFLLAGCLCIVMVFVLASLLRFDEPGVVEWTVANAAAFVAYILYALSRQLPPFVAIEVANGIYAFATLAVLAGFLRFEGRKVPLTALAVVLAAFVALLAFFHYWHESFAARVITFSLFHGTIMAIIAKSVFRTRDRRQSSYPLVFTGMAATLLVVVNMIRGIVYQFQAGEATSLLQPTSWSIFFISVNALVLPTLTFGAMMMVHHRMLLHAANATSRDFLTGAQTRSIFLERIEREWERSRSTGRKLSVLMIEVDRMQSFRKAFGNAAGDQFMVNVALLADGVFRSTDCFARMGGAEFAALLPQTGAAVALKIAQRLMARVAKAAAPVELASGQTGSPACTVSIGLAVLREGESIPDLLAHAQTALHAASAAGGNRVEFAGADSQERIAQNAGREPTT